MEKLKYPPFEMGRSVLIVFTFLLACFAAQAQPYPQITAKKSGSLNSLSPDPIFNYKWANPKATDGLEAYSLNPIRWFTIDPDSFNMTNFKKSGEIIVNGKGDIRFDFGRTNAGWLEFESDDMADSITMSVSEYNEPAIVNSGALNPVKTLSPVKHGHTYRLELNPELYEGVRFGWIHVLKNSRPWRIHNIRLVCQVKPVNYQGSFSCSDKELTRIWYTGAYTVKLNLLKDYFGAILMERSDRQSWTGDAYPSQAASMVAFGNFDFVKANLINTSGLDNGIASYSMYWVLSLIDYVNYTGDIDFARQYMANACKKLDTVYAQYGQLHKLGFYGWDERLGAGFENPDNPESQRAYTMLTIRAWLEFGQLMKKIGEPGLGKKYIDYANRKMKEQRNNKDWPDNFGLHASADAINTGLTSKQENSLFFINNYADRVNRLSYSPFNEYFIICAMAKMGRYDDAISAIKDCWGGQIGYGGTTFFEDYRPSWNKVLAQNDAPPNNQCGYTSLTHPWSAGVVKWLSEEVTGIKPLKPGFKTFEIVPHLPASLSWVKGSIPTPKGLILAYFNINKGITTFTIPAETMAKRIAIPLGTNSIKTVYLNNRLIEHANAYNISNGYLNLNNIKPGTYHYKLIYKPNSRPVTPYKNLTWYYPINRLTQDSLTSGNWKTRYGKDGYILFNYQKQGGDVKKLPAYITAITEKNGANLHLDLKETGTNLLSDSAGTERHLGAIITQDPNPTLQTMIINLQVNDTRLHRVALYFLDWDTNNRRSALEIFDLKTLKLIAPVQLIKKYQNGKYLVFNYSNSIRIRINQVRGKNAALSGLFFD